MSRIKQAVIIGGGFAGLSAACYMQRAGYRTLLLDKNPQPGGRAQFAEEAGFKFSLGPNWYTMADIYEDFFKDFGHSRQDLYSLIKLAPAYKTFIDGQELSAQNIDQTTEDLNNINSGDGLGFKRLVNRSKLVYADFKLNFLYKSWNSKLERFSLKTALNLAKLPKEPYTEHLSRLVKSSRAQDLLAVPAKTIFGQDPKELSSVYSFLPYSTFEQGIFYPVGGFKTVLESVQRIAMELGVEIYQSCEVSKIESEYGLASAVILKDSNERIPADIIIAATDYQHAEGLLEYKNRSYKPKFWNKKEYSPSALIISLGLNAKTPHLSHHNNFMAIGGPSFYVCCASKTDLSLAPEYGEGLTITIPIPAGKDLSEDDTLRIKSFVYEEISKVVGFRIEEHIQVEHTLSHQYFKTMFNASGGSAFGLKMNSRQIFWKRPRTRSKRLNNLLYAGQDANPGPSVPFAIASGRVAAYAALNKKNPS